MSSYHVVDSSGWLEYFADTERAKHFEAPLTEPEHLIVPVITIYEVFKKVLRERGEDAALQVASQMQAGTVVDLNMSLALEAARHPLPLADSLIYATALRWNAELWTQDEHFKDLPGVNYFPKSSSAH
ncbi:type II toxin-antitoxin system VapC family toxin [Haloferula sp.]|uniref:type II toxin-antitoxin system VapC family toxin n=1 Tax=Haloferula sp. TaxID=2497595 RepID=UPI003C77B096